jgi:hypothetical protein
VVALFGKTRVVKNSGAGRNQLSVHLFGKPPSYRHGLPGTLAEELMRSMDVAVGKPARHGLDALASPGQKKPPHIATTPLTTLSSPHRFQKILERLLRATRGLKQLFLVHRPLVENSWTNVKHLT